MTNEEINTKFEELCLRFSEWKDEVVIFLNDIDDPDTKEIFRDLLTNFTVGTAAHDINVRTGVF